MSVFKTLTSALVALSLMVSGFANAGVDPVQPDPNTGANFNRYAYANNNPYRYTDPDGRQAADLRTTAMQAELAGKNVQEVRTAEMRPIGEAINSAGATIGYMFISQFTDGPGGVAGGAIGAFTKAEGAAQLTVKGMTGHAVDQAINRGVKPAQILDAVKNPLKVAEKRVDALGRESQKAVGAKATVVINPESGKIVTVYPTSTKTAEKLLKEAK